MGPNYNKLDMNALDVLWRRNTKHKQIWDHLFTFKVFDFS